MALSKVSFLRFMTLSTATFAAEFGLEALSTQDTALSKCLAIFSFIGECLLNLSQIAYYI
uniref:Uncharacterized protein n=1 Tax=Rhizophagus irregularis (strain DAOM 181602 / DAOM 197198 / MUCL 43194) TaxID=747089 RepID=U9UHD7_RHIID